MKLGIQGFFGMYENHEESKSLCMYVGVGNDWCVRETDLNSNFLCSPVGNC